MRYLLIPLKWMPPTMRISLGLVSLLLSAIFGAALLGLMPNRSETVLQGRMQLCEAIAVNCSLAAKDKNYDAIGATLAAAVDRNPQLLSAGMRGGDGKLWMQAGKHETLWAQRKSEQSTPTHIHIPLKQGEKVWASVEMTFEELPDTSMLSMLGNTTVQLSVFVGVMCFLAFSWYLKRVMRQLDPSKVIPDRVRTTLDTLAEGVLVLDQKQRIVLANQAFVSTLGQSAASLLGQRITALPWQKTTGTGPVEHPWDEALSDGKVLTGLPIAMDSPAKGKRTFMVNAAPILGDDGKPRGVLATFDDVTSVEEMNSELQNALDSLRKSRDEVERQNRKLEELATHDPLTHCLNRRSFFSEFEAMWSSAHRYSHDLAVVIMDIDKFKSVNDNHGHSMGDRVLQQVAETLKKTVRDCDIVARYGGEEFCVLLPHTDIAGGYLAAERLRKAIEQRNCCDLGVTSSFGVSAVGHGAETPTEMVDQADQSLYCAKRTGRNRVVRWDEFEAIEEAAEAEHKDDASSSESGEKKARKADEAAATVTVPYHVVGALCSALAHRDTATAQHSRRVADLAVAVGKQMMSVSQCYILEVAALLHDIGKLGVPDSILLKPGPLTDEEWAVMQKHSDIGDEIVASAFACPELTDLVRFHHAWYGGNPKQQHLPCGEDIPVGARILAIADAFDAIVSDRVYRPGRSADEAFEELRRCAGEQFDEQLVELFVQVVSTQSHLLKRQGDTDDPMLAVLECSREIENLARLIEARDVASMAVLAHQLAASAASRGANEVVSIAEGLEAMAHAGELDEAAHRMKELLDLCGEAQQRMTEQGAADGSDLRQHSDAA